MIFAIKKGRHFSNNFLYKLFSSLNFNDKLSYFITFKDSTLYTDETLDKFDINKLIGFSNGLHHRNSYRFGWNCLDNRIHIYAYCYIKGKRVTKEVCSININETYKFIIKLKNNKCIFTIIDSEYLIKQAIIEVPTTKVFGYELWPYFGGNKTAPHKIEIEINKD